MNETKGESKNTPHHVRRDIVQLVYMDCLLLCDEANAHCVGQARRIVSLSIQQRSSRPEGNALDTYYCLVYKHNARIVQGVKPPGAPCPWAPRHEHYSTCIEPSSHVPP